MLSTSQNTVLPLEPNTNKILLLIASMWLLGH